MVEYWGFVLAVVGMRCGGLIGDQLFLLEMMESSAWVLLSSWPLGFTVFAAFGLVLLLDCLALHSVWFFVCGGVPGCSHIVTCLFSSVVCAIFRLWWSCGQTIVPRRDPGKLLDLGFTVFAPFGLLLLLGCLALQSLRFFLCICCIVCGENRMRLTV